MLCVGAALVAALGQLHGAPLQHTPIGRALLHTDRASLVDSH